MNEQVTMPLWAATAADAAWDGVLVTIVTGEVDLDNAEELAAELAARADEQPTALVVDLDRVVFFGSRGVTTLLNARRRVQAVEASASRLRFSLPPRSRGECGRAKNTGSPVAVIFSCKPSLLRNPTRGTA